MVRKTDASLGPVHDPAAVPLRDGPSASGAAGRWYGLAMSALPSSCRRRFPVLATVAAAVASVAAASEPAQRGARQAPPSIVVVSVDTLRTDRMSCYGYRRPTSPNVDLLAAEGVRFTAARTVVPLTTPAMASAFTGVPPHVHGSSRNGLRMKEGLDSAGTVLAEAGWLTGAVVSNWTLRDSLSRMGEHFEHYQEVFTRKRWFGLVNSEASAVDVTDAALRWLDRIRATSPDRPVLLWVHYVEPHAPYRMHDEYADRLGVPRRDPSRSDRYDTEIAAVDEEVGRLLRAAADTLGPEPPAVVFLADHGESLGEHDYWGHGRNLHWPSLRIPLIVSWPERIAPGTVDVQATILDLAPTLLGLAGLEPPSDWSGTDWTPHLEGRGTVGERSLCYQAHKGAVQIRHDSDRARSRGLLEVGRIEGTLKEVFDLRTSTAATYDLAADPAELAGRKGPASESLLDCLGEITEGLGALDHLKADTLDEESVERLRALGYLE